MSTDVVLNDRTAGWAIHDWLSENVGQYGEDWKYGHLDGVWIKSIWFRDNEDAMAFILTFGL